MQVNLSIVGLDRISVSFGLALKRYQEQSKDHHTFTIIGSDNLGGSMKAAHKLGAIDNFDRKLLKATENANIILINVPARDLEALYERLGPTLKPGTVVLDLSELKSPGTAWGQQFFPKTERGALAAYVVELTPIVTVTGLYVADMSPEAADADLFKDAEVLLTPDSTCPGEAITLAEDIVKLVGGKPRFMDPIEHDGLSAATEQLPALLGAALFYTLQQSEGWSELRRMVNPNLALASQSLRYRTPDDFSMLFTQNRENLLRNLEGLIGMLDQVRDILDENDTDRLEAFLALVGKGWETWDIKRHSGKWEDLPSVETLPGPLGSMTGFLTMTRRKKNQKDDEDN